MSETKSKTHPLIVTAAVAVTLFSLVGVGVMTGFIPNSLSSDNVKRETEAKAAQAAAAKTAAPAARNHTPPVATSATRPATQTATREPVQRPVPAQPAVVARICSECGVIDSVKVVDHKGEASGLGAVGGAVVGGLVGTQIGSGRGTTAATVIGAAGGALAGNEVEKRVKASKQYAVTVRMDDGSFRTVTFESEPGYSIGDKVKVVDGRIVRNS
jgi:outer membrane lipoprotein SlyB